jgi:hypothetical protein
MNFHVQSITALAIAAAFGAGGYFLGKNQPRLAPESRYDPQRQTENASSPARKPVLPAIDPVKLRAELDAETNPLARFKLALQNLEFWVARDPVGALDWLASQQASERRDEVIRMALEQFSETNAKGAADWAMANLRGAELNNAIISIAENWAQENGAEAAAWFAKQPPSEERHAAAEAVYFNWAANQPGPALDSLGQDTAWGDLSPALRRAALAGWAKSEPEAATAASLALSRTHQDPAQFSNTLANWATVDLEASSEWLLKKLPAGPERAAAAEELAVIYAKQSPDAGVAWLGQLDAGAERDAAGNSLAKTWARSAPSEAAKWAANQNEVQLSPQTVTSIGRNFLMKDAEAFQAWRAALPEGPLKTQLATVGKTAAGRD